MGLDQSGQTDKTPVDVEVETLYTNCSLTAEKVHRLPTKSEESIFHLSAKVTGSAKKKIAVDFCSSGAIRRV